MASMDSRHVDTYIGFSGRLMGTLHIWFLVQGPRYVDKQNMALPRNLQPLNPMDRLW